MSTYSIITIFISLILGVVTYVSTNSFIYSGIALLISFIYFFLIGMRMVKSYNIKVTRFHQCYNFINTFIVSLSIKGSIKGALESTFETMPLDFHKNIRGIDELNEQEKIKYLGQYFKFHIYGLFTNLINLWNEQGGDVLEMSTHLVNDVRLIEEYINESSRLSKKHLLEFAILWLFSLSIIVVLRFALSQFYEKIATQFYYPLAILAVVILCLITIHVALMRMSNLEIRGWENGK